MSLFAMLVVSMDCVVDKLVMYDCTPSFMTFSLPLMAKPPLALVLGVRLPAVIVIASVEFVFDALLFENDA